MHEKIISLFILMQYDNSCLLYYVILLKLVSSLKICLLQSELNSPV